MNICHKKVAYLLVVLTAAVTLPLAGALAKGKALPEGVINVNTASAEDLQKLPGVGKAKADAIIAYRESHPFKAVSELTEVKGIGPKMLEKMQAYVTIDGGTTVAPSPSTR